ncbi:MAG TPA: hypothetical protein VFB32_07425 [Rudaea sp.]|nr:hypothetical protein [Rudaea sp.]
MEIPRICAVLLGCAIALVPPKACADDAPLAEAMRRGLVGKPPASRHMTPARWEREQRAAVDKSETLMHRALEEPGLLAQYAFMKARYDGDDDRVFRMVFGQYLSWFQTWIGDYDGARASFSIARAAQRDDAASPVDGGFHARPAAATILALARDRKAVFFNEDHSAPVTRTLTVELLAGLRAQGFDYFAAETLSTSAEALPHGYPTARNGFYANEPICGEMLRTALRLGYHVVAYDVEESAPDLRERASAQALYEKVFRRDPDARLVVDAGFSHIQKSGDYLGGASMAQVFEKISGIEPLAVEQTMMIEHPRAADDHPYYRAAVVALHPTAPFVYVNDSGAAWTLKPRQYDISVFFPPETRDGGRPGWLSLDGQRRPFPVSGADCRERFPCLIEARYAEEGADAVAADRVSLDADVQSRLYLFPGTYRLSALDRDGNVIAARDIGL